MLSLRWRLIYWIFGGFIILFIVPLEWKESLCAPKEPNIWTVQGERNTAHGQRGPDEINSRLIIEQKQPTNDQKEGSAPYLYRLLPHWLCDESRFTDFLIAYFTYCLAVLGWFGIRSTDTNLENLERAYVFHGYSPLEFRGGQARFTLVMINSGRMPGLITEVGWKFLDRKNLPLSRDKADWKWETIEYDFGIRPSQRWDICRFLSLQGDHIFVSYIKYRDMFSKRMHTSWMGMHIYPAREDAARAGGDAWNDWD